MDTTIGGSVSGIICDQRDPLEAQAAESGVTERGGDTVSQREQQRRAGQR